MNGYSRPKRLRWVGILMLAGVLPVLGGSGALQMREGYFWDPAKGDYFIARGMAYQTFNPPVGANQTVEQLRYDFARFKEMHCNSVRCEMVWNEVEPRQGEFDWSRPDALVSVAEEFGLKLFVLVGFNYAPAWFPTNWTAVNSMNQTSVVLNYEHPDVRRTYSNYIARVTGRYRDSTSVGAWILGNEYAYFDLWNPEHNFLGYDEHSLASFREWLEERYQGDIGTLNSVWRTAYTGFESIAMPRVFPVDRDSPAYDDLIRWRERSIGNYVAVGATAARGADPNHLQTYSMIGGLFIGYDSVYTCEDARTIVESCEDAGAPLDFWAINNYAWATLNSEMRTADFGIAKHRFESGLPIFISETGHSTTDNLLPGAAGRQAEAVPTQMWEALMSGAIGTHVFTWNDRDLFGGVFVREKGFGVVNQDRTWKVPAYENLAAYFRRVEEIRPERLFPGSRRPASEVGLLWSGAAKMGWPRANQENAMLWNSWRRVGYQAAILTDATFEAGAYTNQPALALSRCFMMEPRHLELIRTEVVGRGIHLHANADLPGEFDGLHRDNPAWPAAMAELFGLDVDEAVAGLDGMVIERDPTPDYRWLFFRGVSDLGELRSGLTGQVRTWKIWHGIRALAGTTVVTHTGRDGTQSPMPALQVHQVGEARTAVNTFALADLYRDDGDTRPMVYDWDHRYRWLRAIYREHFGLIPAVDLSGPGAAYVIPDYRLGPEGTVLISLLNCHTNAAEVMVSAAGLLMGKTVEDLTQGGVVETASDGVFELTLEGDQYALMYAYRREAGGDTSRLNGDPNKLWFVDAPLAVWPRDSGYSVSIGFDTVESVELTLALERVSWPPAKIEELAGIAVAGRGDRTLDLVVPDVDMSDLAYRSSADGGAYRWRARLWKAGEAIAEVSLPVRLLWGVRPVGVLPRAVTAGGAYEVRLEWQDLPAYELGEQGLPLSRMAAWQGWAQSRQHYAVVLEMRDPQGRLLAQRAELTREGSGEWLALIEAPANYTGPVQWLGYLRPAPGVSVDLLDDFENRGPGGQAPHFLEPWVPYAYAQVPGTVQYFDGGVGVPTGRFVGEQFGFLVYTNPPSSGAYAGFGLTYEFPKRWSLPAERAQWTNFTFSVRFRELTGLPCRLELQLTDDQVANNERGVLRYDTEYVPGTDGWMTVAAVVSEFEPAPFGPNVIPGRIKHLVINVEMLEKSATYVAYVDDVVFDGPEAPPPVMVSHDLMDGFEDRLRGSQSGAAEELLAPWGSYVYSAGNAAQLWDLGVHTNALEGFSAAFLMATNGVAPGDFAGFGLYRVFPMPWALPVDRKDWWEYRFGFDFHESLAQPCRIEMQVKSGASEWMEYGRDYVPGVEGWDRIEADLADDGWQVVGAFDPSHIESVALNVRMLASPAVYLGSIDRVTFDGPEEPLPPEFGYGVYRSSNDSDVDSDGDGLSDSVETGTGEFKSEEDTGTMADRADSDGDGYGDGDEVLAGTDPNDSSDYLRFSSITRLVDGSIGLEWVSRESRLYTVYAADVLSSGETTFQPIPGLIELPGVPGERVGVLDLPPVEDGERFYRLGVRPVW